MGERHVQPEDPGHLLLQAVDRASLQLGALAELAGAQERGDLATVLAAAVAHEIGNILTPVRGYAEIALAHPQDRDLAARALREAADGAERAMRAAEAVIESVGPRHGAEPRANVRLAARAAARLLGGPADQQVTIEGDDCGAAIGQVSLEQVLLNLLLNAKAAARPGELHALIRIHSTWNTPTPRIRIEIEDFGRGIPADRLAHLFESGTSQARRSGRGLGLLICRHLIESAGGSISVRSQVGRGTCFVIELAGAAQHQSKAA